jgi:O-antigen/teichoic acid export membrane protein
MMNISTSQTMSKTGLRSRIVHAGTWTLVGHVTSQVVRLGSNMIMTRLLVPEMFGIMALANVLLMGLQLFSDLGLSQNIVQSRRGHDPVFLNTVWTVQIVRGGIIWLFALAASFGIFLFDYKHLWPAGSVYAEPVLPYVIAALSFSAAISGFNSTKLATASRDLALRHVTLIDLLSQVIGIVIMVVWAWFERSIWALVVGALISSIVRMVLSHVVLPGLANRLHWDSHAFHEIFHFGKWVFLTSILGFLVMNGDRLILGGLTNASTLGLYAIAFFMVNSIQQIFTKIFGSVAFPALSEVVRERPDRLKQTYYKFRTPIDVSTLLATGFLFSAGHLLIRLLYDERYLPAGHMLEILSIALFEVRYNLLGQCFIALGKPKLLAPIISIRLIALYALMPLLFKWYGLDGAIWIAGGSALFGLPLIIYLKIRHGLFDFVKELRVLPVLLVGYMFGLLVTRILMQI